MYQHPVPIIYGVCESLDLVLRQEASLVPCNLGKLDSLTRIRPTNPSIMAALMILRKCL